MKFFRRNKAKEETNPDQRSDTQAEKAAVMIQKQLRGAEGRRKSLVAKKEMEDYTAKLAEEKKTFDSDIAEIESFKSEVEKFKTLLRRGLMVYKMPTQGGFNTKPQTRVLILKDDNGKECLCCVATADGTPAENKRFPMDEIDTVQAIPTPGKAGDIDGWFKIVHPKRTLEIGLNSAKTCVYVVQLLNKVFSILHVPDIVPDALRKKYKEFGQEHVFKYVDTGRVPKDECATFVKQLEGLDLQRIEVIRKAALAADRKGPPVGDMQPLDKFGSTITGTETDKKAWFDAGMDAIAKNEVCALVLSGGQGTRLGFDYPKGMFNIELPSNKTLFQIFAERLLRLKAMAKEKSGNECSIPWYIMTSPMNDAVTKNFFNDKKFFGLPEKDVIFFTQGTLPPLTEGGKLMLETRSRVGAASDGNGGIYPSLNQSGSLKDMETRGIKYCHTFAVDNALCKVADPTFLGYCIAEGADCGNKVLWKTEATESVGVVAKRDGKYCVIEYSEISGKPEETATDAQGKLVYGAGNICNHFYTVDFLKKCNESPDALIYHVARKKIPVPDQDDASKSKKPDTNNGMKLECFIFDVFPVSQKMAVLEVDRASEFSPVKNKEGKDSPASAREMFSALSKKWLGEAGATIKGDGLVEVSPLTSYNGEGLEKQKGAALDTPISV